MSEKFDSSKAPEPVGLYPHARKVGDLLFLSGVGPRERGTKKFRVLNWTKTVALFPTTSQRSVIPCLKMFAIFWKMRDHRGTRL